MASKIKAFLQYVFILGITVFLLWLALRKMVSSDEGLDVWALLLNTWKESDKFFMLNMAVVAMISHAVRAERWRMLLQASMHPSSFIRTFYSLMIGYLVNLAIPRGGELSRCYNLYKLDKTPVEVSLGSVVTERAFDFLCMLLVFVLTLLLEWQTIINLFTQFLENNASIEFSGMRILWVVLITSAILGIILYLLSRSVKFKSKLRRFWMGFRTGLMSFFMLKRKWLFLVHTLSIWILYLFMTKLVLMAFPETASLGWGGVLVIFSVGILAMAIPLPGGAGSYHVLLPLALIGLYTIPESRAVAFTFIFHAWQSFVLVIFGALSLIASFILIKWQAQIKS